LINGLVLREDAAIGAIDIVKAAMAEGLLMVPAGPKVVRLVPPLNITAIEIDEALSKLDRALAGV
jgi:acetylornithine/N-succinyldiaminopimelate aminotransferase